MPSCFSRSCTPSRSSTSTVYCAPHAGAIRSHRDQFGTGAAGADPLGVPGTQRDALPHLPVEAVELGQQHGALQGIHAAAEANTRVVVARALAMHTGSRWRLWRWHRRWQKSRRHRHRRRAACWGRSWCSRWSTGCRCDARDSRRRNSARRSSITTTLPCFAASWLISSMSAGWP
jgi:hypothetical protein